MTNVARAVEKGETEGFMKVLVDADSKEFLGATILGTGGDEVIHCVLDLMYARAPYTVMQWAMHIHPTVSELIPTMLDQLRPLDAGTGSLHRGLTSLTSDCHVRFDPKFRLVTICPSARPIERATRQPRMGPQSTAFPAQPSRP